MTKLQIYTIWLSIVLLISSIVIIDIELAATNKLATHREEVLKDFIKSKVDMNKVLQNADSTNIEAIVIVNE